MTTRINTFYKNEFHGDLTKISAIWSQCGQRGNLENLEYWLIIDGKEIELANLTEYNRLKALLQ